MFLISYLISYVVSFYIMIDGSLNTNKERSCNDKKYLKLSDVLVCLVVSIFSPVVIFLCIIMFLSVIWDIVIWKEKEK